MAQAQFFYQSKTDPSRFLAPPVDLSWMQTTGRSVLPAPGGRSVEANPAWFLPQPLAATLDWLPVAIAPSLLQRLLMSSQANPVLFFPFALGHTPWQQTQATAPALRTRLLSSPEADSSWYLAIAPPPDLSWMPQAPGPVLRPAVAAVGRWSDPSTFVEISGGAQIVTDDGQASLPWTDRGTVAMVMMDDRTVRL